MAEPAVLERLMTAEEFWRLPGGDGRSELVYGRVVEMPPPGPDHSRHDRRVTLPLAQYVEQHGLGEVFPNCGFILRRNPDLVRAPDSAFVSNDRMQASPPPDQGYWPVAPELAVEVVSPNDTAEDVLEKVQEYLAADVRLVWVIYPRRRQVYVYAPGRPPQVLSGASALEGEDVVPGFTLPLEHLWKQIA